MGDFILPGIENQNEQLLNLLKTLQEALSDISPEQAYAHSVGRGSAPVSFLESFSSGQSTDSPGTPSEIIGLIEQAKLCCRAPITPIISVLGLLNAGKSSLVATFLSEANRQRVLVGSSNSQGTHRFILWVPEEWNRHPKIWEFILTRLRSVFGCDSELLSNDPLEAAAQYNDTLAREFTTTDGQVQYRPTIQIPLIATDHELNRWGLAIMDCPDVQTGLLPQSDTGASDALFHERTQWIADSRLQVLAQASQLCSAFLIVLPANAMHDQTVSRLMRVLQQRMPSVHQFVAVNRVPRKYETVHIQQELHKLYGHLPIHRRYMAYSFDGPLQRDRIPAPPTDYQEPQNQPLPLFFRIDASKPPQPPASIQEPNWLLQIGSQLDKQSLLQDALNSTVMQLMVRVQEGLMYCEARARQSQQATKQLRSTLADACLDFSIEGSDSTRDSRVRLHASKQIVQQISKSLERTAPWWAMPGRWTTRLAESSKASIAKSASWLQWPSWFSGKTESIGRWIQSRWTSGQSGKIITAESLVHTIQRHDINGHLRLDESQSQTDSTDHPYEQVKLACQRAIDRFQNESRIELDPQELEKVTSRMWAEMTLGKRLLTGFAPAGILFAPLIAVLMIPVDFGGAVLVCASIKELLFAGVAGVGLIMASADSMPKIAESEVAWQQFGDLYAVLCDELGVGRPSASEMPSVRLGTTKRAIPESHIQPPSTNTIQHPILAREIRINSQARDAIKSLLTRFAASCS
ncbi:MAG: hypothetical protein ABL921_13565 [Pirellula sp.]